MNRNYSRFLILLLLILSLSVCSVAEPSDPESSSRQTIAVLLPAVEGYQSILADDDTPLPDVLDLYITAAESIGDQVRLQGSTNNNNASALRYSTDPASGVYPGIDWSTIPVRGNELSLSNTIASLDKDGYNDYHKLVILSGKMTDAIRTEKKAVRLPEKTWLIQLTPFTDGSTLIQNFAKIAGLSLDETGETGTEGFVQYEASRPSDGAAGQIRFKNMERYQAEELLDSLLRETLFEGCNEITDHMFVAPGALLENSILYIAGESVPAVEMISPDGSIWPVETQQNKAANGIRGYKMKLGSREAMIVPLPDTMASGIWKLSGTGSEQTVRQYFTLKDTFYDVVQSISFVEDNYSSDHLAKGTVRFTLSEDPVLQDLLVLYPRMNLRVTDTFNKVMLADVNAGAESPYQAEVEFRNGGDHLLTFRLMDGNQEISKQSQTIHVEDEAPVFLLGEAPEILILYDTYENNLWKADTKEWFSDPDEDKITISRPGGNSKKIMLSDDGVLSFQGKENELDGNEELLLRARSDISETECKVRLVWRSLAKELNGLTFDCVITPVDAETGLTKRSQVQLTAKAALENVDREAVTDQLSSCAARILDRDGNEVTTAHYNQEEQAFVSDIFLLPDTSGNYFWTIQLTSAEDRLPQWSRSIHSKDVRIENHAPAAHPELLSEQVESGALRENQYCYFLSDWKLNIPSDIITDPDGDPITYQIFLNDQEYISEKNPLGIVLSDFGDQKLQIQGSDNEGQKNAAEMIYYFHVNNLLEILQQLPGTIRIEPEKEAYQKREPLEIALQIKSDQWNAEERQAISDWLSKCKVIPEQNGTPLENTEFRYDPEKQLLYASITAPVNAGEYTYHITLQNGETQNIDVSNGQFEDVKISVANSAPVVNGGEDKELSYSEWVMDASEYDQVVIPTDLMVDADGDELTRHIKLINEKGETVTELTDQNTEPYTLRFAPMAFLHLTEKYTAEVTLEDNDQQSNTRRITIELKNKKLLFAIIAAAVVILIAIIIIILYANYRKNLPSFTGTIVFTSTNGKTVSREIDLTPWGKTKHLPLVSFAGSITMLLNDEQWNAMKKLELRPDKRNGFRLHKASDKKNAQGAVIPYSIADGLQLEQLHTSHERVTMSRT